MIVSTVIASVCAFVGLYLLYTVKRVNVTQQSEEQNVHMVKVIILMCVAMIVAIFVGGATALVAYLNGWGTLYVLYDGGIAIGCTIVSLYHVFNWMDSEIAQGHPSN